MPKRHRSHNSASGYDLASSVYDKKEGYLNSFEQGKAIPLLGHVAGREILDVGAGTGRLALPLALSGARVTALDISAGMLSVLARKDRGKHVRTVLGEAEALPFAGETFDAVTAAFVIVHLKDPRRFFDEAYRVLKNGGLFLITNINQKDPPEINTPEGNIVIESYYHRPERVREVLAKLAFSIEREETIRENGVWINQIILARK
ncbi:MAG: Methyltransferase type 11 [Candidatus Magasanikbacteria bacterium GW2011_GWA2_56_11]|uniref:Methyltransferase type 11 n=1 Tax=Candidatus Magasanikbacteria bacterium GW2011_GWA2_56_11 TaxID=1619044 RepID=A0A0G1YGX2_9BACT|nr:MAG: Methyltransferase type 11 [Candidatus Magasanikbacteria bacterium GW2011_GWA2_56_11]